MIKEVKMYTIICDNCKKDLCEGGEFSCLSDKSHLEDMAFAEDWIIEDHHYCPDCFSFGDNDELIIDKKRKKL